MERFVQNSVAFQNTSVPIMILKLALLDSPDVAAPDKYPQHMPEVLRKRFRGSRLYGKTKGILLPRNYLEFPLVKVKVSKFAYKSL